jgi:hypothetical protein
VIVECRHHSYEEIMRAGAEQYQDVLESLSSAGLPAVFTQTGGMCAALEIRLETGWSVLVTEAEDSLTWDRSEHATWRAGLYPDGNEHDQGALAYEATDDGSIEALLDLIRSLLAGPILHAP